MKIQVRTAILGANDEVAGVNRAVFDHLGILALNLMASPGAGKTSLIMATLDRLPPHIRPAVIEGDLASRIDADLIAARGVPVTQINTGGGCHLDAPMIRAALPDLPIESTDMLFVENVGNLVCTADFALGTQRQVVVASVPEGHDKPYKYPAMFACADAIVLNKVDLLPYFDFDLDYFWHGVELVNPRVPRFAVTCRGKQPVQDGGVDAWVAWLLDTLERGH
jgi:hydrogenase nickel incorporation protein HypB